MDLILFSRPQSLFYPNIFSAHPPSRKCKVILSNVQRAFHLHFMVSGAISKLEWEFVHATVGPEQTKSSLKRAARLLCISKVLLLEFVLGQYYMGRWE